MKNGKNRWVSKKLGGRNKEVSLGGAAMKRFLCIFSALLMMATLGAYPAAAVVSEMEEAEVKTVAEDYLSARMRKIYLYEDYDLVSGPKTLLAVERSASHTVGMNEKISDTSSLSVPTQRALTVFAERSEPELMASMKRETVSISDMMRDLQCMEDMTAYKSYVYEHQGFAYSDFDAQYYFDTVVVDGNFATVVVYEELNYQYDDCVEPSYELGEYNLVLAKVDGEWIIADVASDDVAFMGYFKTGYNLSEELAAFDEAIRKVLTQVEESSDSENSDETSSLAVAANDIYYNKDSAANYALTYTTQSDDGNATPSFKNDRFKWFGKDCMNFCSQAVWAGFGGSNSWADIPAKNGMDTTGSATWWCTKSAGTSSWASCGEFRTYLGNVASDTTGITSKRKNIPGDTSSLSFTKTELVGAVLHVEGYVDNVATKLAHAVFVTSASGNTRDTVMVCSYNRCKKNVKLSSVCNVGGTTKQVEVMIPQTFKAGKPDLFVCGKLFNVVTSQAKSLNLAGYCNQTADFSMTLMKPDGSVARTWPATNATSITATYNAWTVSGEWIVKVTATTSDGGTATWYGMIRVVL